MPRLGVRLPLSPPQTTPTLPYIALPRAVAHRCCTVRVWHDANAGSRRTKNLLHGWTCNLRRLRDTTVMSFTIRASGAFQRQPRQPLRVREPICAGLRLYRYSQTCPHHRDCPMKTKAKTALLSLIGILTVQMAVACQSEPGPSNTTLEVASGRIWSGAVTPTHR